MAGRRHERALCSQRQRRWTGRGQLVGCRRLGRDDEGQVELELPCGPILWRLLCPVERGTELVCGRGLRGHLEVGGHHQMSAGV